MLDSLHVLVVVLVVVIRTQYKCYIAILNSIEALQLLLQLITSTDDVNVLDIIDNNNSYNYDDNITITTRVMNSIRTYTVDVHIYIKCIFNVSYTIDMVTVMSIMHIRIKY